MKDIDCKNILIVDYYFAVVEGLKTIILREFCNLNFFNANNHSDALKIITHENIDCVILDIDIPKKQYSKPFEFEGIELISEIRELNPKARIITIVESGRAGLIRKINSFEVEGLIFKNQLAADLLVAIRIIVNNKKYLQNNFLGTENNGIEAKKQISVSVIQEQILHLLADGKKITQISKLINKSERTIDRNLSDLRLIFDANNNIELITKAFRLGFLE